jgi:DNA invertase Pin-like site-specific DNA recombinase
MAAIAYVRVSSEMQAESGAGLAAQRTAIDNFAARAGLTVAAIHEDAAISGAKGMEDRPGLMAAIGQLRRGDVLLIAKRDRIGRDQMAILMIERAVARRGASIMSADGVGNGSGAADQFMKAVVDAASEYERNMIRSRTKAAMHEKRAQGVRVGDVPFGWEVGVDGLLIAVESEQLVLASIIDCRKRGMSLRQIATILSDAGILTKKGKATWYAATIKSILDRADSMAA